MAREELENLSKDELKKGQKFVSFILGISIGLMLLFILLLILKQKDFIYSDIPLGLFLTGLPMLIGLKKINKELRRRGQK